VAYLRQAGARAFARSANREAVTHLEQALTALGHLPSSRETLEQSVDVRLALRNALWPLGRFEEGFGHLRDAERMAAELGDPRRLGWIAAYMAEHTRMTGNAAEAPAFAERALAIGETLEDLTLRVAANYYLATSYFVAGDYRRTDGFFRSILQLLAGDRFRERCGLAGFPVVMSRMFWTLALAERGEFDRGIGEGQEGVRLAEMLDHPYSLACAWRGLGRVLGAQGNLDDGIRLTERSLALAHERHLIQLLGEVAAQLGYMYAVSGRVAEGLRVLDEALAAMEAMGMVQWRTALLVYLGETYLLANRPGDALALAGRSLSLASQLGHRGSEAWGRRLLGEIAARGDHPDVATAEAHYGAGIVLASELGMRPLVAHCELGLGQLHRRQGNPAKADQHLAAATALYREMAMTFWLGKVEAS
jgi:tetratricopeptide (TPR) repeat protein